MAQDQNHILVQTWADLGAHGELQDGTWLWPLAHATREAGNLSPKGVPEGISHRPPASRINRGHVNRTSCDPGTSTLPLHCAASRRGDVPFGRCPGWGEFQRAAIWRENQMRFNKQASPFEGNQKGGTENTVVFNLNRFESGVGRHKMFVCYF